jgi:hypothetical protein
MAVIETGRNLLLCKDCPINKQKLKMGTISSRHTVGGKKIFVAKAGNLVT